MGILQVASYIYKRYMDDFGVRIDEMKLQIWVKLRIKEEGVAYDTPSSFSDLPLVIVWYFIMYKTTFTSGIVIIYFTISFTVSSNLSAPYFACQTRGLKR